METTNPTLKNRVALVTGGGRGIGHAISVGLAEPGARVAVLARSADQVRDTAGRITRSGGEALALPADVGDPDQVAAALGALGSGAARLSCWSTTPQWSGLLDPARQSTRASGRRR